MITRRNALAAAGRPHAKLVADPDIPHGIVLTQPARVTRDLLAILAS